MTRRRGSARKSDGRAGDGHRGASGLSLSPPDREAPSRRERATTDFLAGRDLYASFRAAGWSPTDALADAFATVRGLDGRMKRRGIRRAYDAERTVVTTKEAAVA